MTVHGIPDVLDHLVYATPDLAGTVADFTRRTGVAPVAGGAHPDRGTANYLVGLGGRSYLEIIGPDPGQPEPARPRPFGLDGLTAAKVVTWAIRPADVDATVARARQRGYDPGEVRPLSRRRPDGSLLEWRLTPSEDAHPSGLVPFLIDWGDAAHPTAAGLPETPLTALTAQAPDPVEIASLLAAVDVGLPVRTGPLGLTFTIDTPNGPVTVA
ncbi:VOC family protein [Actinoallomurus sp. NBC_01490]|uniref:VOC family protein n=1 Tax=Actinoallomurus sp. NBC_01490 TaxID=2903557 RepID=UPI002E322587|nr:VOC family protein [Actinoallomurus sp. NBC_01490]